MSSEIQKAIEEGGITIKNTCICFTCKHSMVFVRAVSRPQINPLSHKVETKMEVRDQATCCRWASPMLIGTDVEVQACTEWELGPVKSLKSPGESEPGISVQ